MNRRLLVAAAATLLSTTACIFHIGADGDARSSWQSSRSLESAQRHNRGKIDTLELGMTLEQVREHMGTSAIWAGDQVGWIDNPYRSESFRATDGTSVRLAFYYTNTTRHDGAISDDELTPLAFRNGVLVGWGWSYVRREIKEV